MIEEYKENLNRLENLVLCMGERDVTVIPRESAHFGYFLEGRVYFRISWLGFHLTSDNKNKDFKCFGRVNILIFGSEKTSSRFHPKSLFLSGVLNPLENLRNVSKLSDFLSFGPLFSIITGFNLNCE